MPMIIITGLPSSGKSYRSTELKHYFEKEHNKKVHVVCENEVISSSNIDKNALCFDSAKEKEVRSVIKSTAQRLIGREDVVIIDAANYIKGKEAIGMNCTACPKAVKPHSVLYNVMPPWLRHGLGIFRDLHLPYVLTGDHPYSRESFDALVMRYETPDSRNRWDSPLFVIHSNERIPSEDIAASLFNRKPPPPNQSTQSAPLSATNYLHELDRITQDIAMNILSAQSSNQEGDVKIPGYSNLVVHLGAKRLTAAQLGRSRRQFLTYSKMHTSSDTSQIGQLFVHYLNTSLQN